MRGFGYSAAAMVVWLAASGCKPGFQLEGATIGVGTTLEVVIDDPDVAEITDVVDQQTGVFSVVDVRRGAFTIEAVSPGTTEITVVALSQEREVLQQDADFEALEVDEVWISPLCDAGRPEGRLLVPPDVELTVYWGMTGAGEELLGHTTLDIDGLDELSADPVARSVTWQTPQTAGGVYPITTPVLGRDVGVVEVFDASQVDAMELGQTSGPDPIRVDGSTTLETLLLVDGEEPCIDTATRLVTLETPTTCSLDADLEVWEARTSEARISVYGLSPGACTVTVALDGTELVRTLELTVID